MTCANVKIVFRDFHVCLYLKKYFLFNKTQI